MVSNWWGGESCLQALPPRFYLNCPPLHLMGKVSLGKRLGFPLTGITGAGEKLVMENN